MFDYLAARIDHPPAWAASFGVSLALTAALLAFREYGLQGALLAAVAVGAAGSVFGWLWGSAIRFFCGLFGGLDRPVRQPDRRGAPLRCVACDWRTTPDGPWSRRNCIQPPEACPGCASPIVPIVPDCPHCATCSVAPGSLWVGVWSQVRWPKNLEAGLWGHHSCRDCGCDYDKWGRKVDS